MREYCLKIVDFKIELDEELQQLSHKKGYFPSIDPVSYGKAIFPFWDDDISARRSAIPIDCYEVVGGNFQDYTNHDKSVKACKQLNASASGGFGAPSYHKVGTFPIYFAWEGKNRVSLFRKHGLDIIADVKDTTYPMANTLKIHRCFFRKLYFLSCSDKSFNAKNKKHQIAFPELTIPLLEAYGVENGSKLFKPFTINCRRKTIKALCAGLMRG